MAFYLSPVPGKVSLQKLENFAITRLKFLMQIYKIGGDRLIALDLVNKLNAVEESDCLIERTPKDVISHYILRLLLVADQETADFFLKAETRLFQFRFSCLTEEEIYKLLKSTEKRIFKREHISPRTYNDENIHHVLHGLLTIKQSAGSWKSVAYRYLQEKESNFLVPFQSVLSLVAKRRVHLEGGWASVAYADLGEVLTGMFSTALRLGVAQTGQTRGRVMGDSRMKRIASVLKSIYRAGGTNCLSWNNLSCLSHDQVDQSEQLFPLCMSNLHKALRANHRLKHNDRIQYSLFLKECGMSAHQAVMFWQTEYSQASTVPGTCLHSWSADHRRYVYSIRHLHGLEGARRNYRGHCCESLQRRQLGLHEQGGCPLVHFDQQHLSDLLTSNDLQEDDLKDILKLVEDRKPCVACGLYLRCKAEVYVRQQGVRHARRGTTTQRSQDKASESNDVETFQMCRENSTENLVVCNGDTDDVPDRVQLSSVEDGTDSNEDVIFVRRDSRQMLRKRRSLSSVCRGRKKRILWYENKNQGSVKTGNIAVPSIENFPYENCDSINSRLDNNPDQIPCISALHEEHSLPDNHAKGSNSAVLTICDQHVPVLAGERDTSSCGCLVDVKEKPTEGVVNDSVSCFEHVVCPSQSHSVLQSQTTTMSGSSVLERLEAVEIHKPIDFYTSYKDLVDGLTNNM